MYILPKKNSISPKKMPDSFLSQHMQTGGFFCLFVFINLYLLFRTKTSGTGIPVKINTKIINYPIDYFHKVCILLLCKRGYYKKYIIDHEE